jgi:diguanylate cyclase (GGDEF)-like protein
MRGLDRLAAAQDRALERLREGSPDRELLVHLLENSCLLELAKLDAGLDLRSCVQLAADIITAMFPVTGCAIVLNTDDERPWVVESGASLHETDVPHRADIVIDGAPAGELCLGPLDADLDARRFIDSAAAQLATTFARAFEGERLRRAAATATASRLAAELDADAPADTLEAIAMQLAAFPGALAAELLVDHPAVGAPLTVRAGRSDEPKPIVVSRALPGSGVLAARIAMHPGAPPPDAALGEVLDRIVGSLERIAREQQLRREVETDPLTGLGNRRRLDRSLGMALSRAARYGEHVAVLLLDFDGFKTVNDTLGHDAGDRVLRNAARAARRVTRGYDEIVRLGGDELVIVSPATELLGALTLAESLRSSIAEATAVSLPADRAITVSVGIALFPDSAPDAESLLRAADVALYDAKARGKNCVAVAPVVEFARALSAVGGDTSEAVATTPVPTPVPVPSSTRARRFLGRRRTD